MSKRAGIDPKCTMTPSAASPSGPAVLRRWEGERKCASREGGRKVRLPPRVNGELEPTLPCAHQRRPPRNPRHRPSSASDRPSQPPLRSPFDQPVLPCLSSLHGRRSRLRAVVGVRRRRPRRLHGRPPDLLRRRPCACRRRQLCGHPRADADALDVGGRLRCGSARGRAQGGRAQGGRRRWAQGPHARDRRPSLLCPLLLGLLLQLAG